MKRIKEFFGSLFPKRKRTSKKKSVRKFLNKKVNKDLLGFSFLESKKAKIGIGIGAAALLLIMVFWGTPEMDNLLKFFGLKAYGDIVVEVTPETGESAYTGGVPPVNQGFYNVKVTPSHNQYGYNHMTVDLEAVDVFELLPLVNQDYVSEVQFFYKDTEIDARHLDFYDNDTTPIDLDLIITTTGAVPLFDTITFFMVKGHCITDSQDPGSELGLAEWDILTGFIELILLADQPTQPDFSMRIEPVTTVVVEGGTPIDYIIYITNLDGFRDTVTLSSADLIDLLNEGGTWPPYLTGIDYPDGLIANFDGMDDNTEIPKRLTLHTTSDTIRFEFPLGFPFKVLGNDRPERFVEGTVMLTEPPPAPDFTINVSYSGAVDELGRIATVPGGSLDFEVTVTRLNGWEDGIVAVDTDLLTGWPLDIDPTTSFENNGVFDETTEISETKILTVIIKDTCVVTDESDINFTVTGRGDTGGGEVERTDSIEFSIMDYALTIREEDTPQTVAAGTPATYRIDIQTLNQFNDFVTFFMPENLVALYPGSISNIEFTPPAVLIPAIGYADPIILEIETLPTSLTINDISFHTEGVGSNTGLVRTSGEGILNIASQRDFTIQVTPLKNRVIPGDEATYSVTATGLLGFSDPVDLSTSWDIPNKPDYIDTISFDDVSIMPGDGVPGVPTTLRILTTIDAPPISSQDPEGQFRVIGISGTHPIRFDNAGLDIIDFIIQITDPVPDISGDSTRTITPGGEATYAFTIIRANDLIEDITLSTDLVSTNGSISNLVFEGPNVIFTGTEYILEYDGSQTQFANLIVSTFNPVPTENMYFHIYGDVTINGSDTLQRQSNRGVLEITNSYDFELNILPYEQTITPSNSAAYIIGVKKRLNGFEGDITLIPVVAELEGEQVIYDFDTLLLQFNGSDTAILTITADNDALGVEIDFTVEGTADLSGTGDLAFRNITGKIIIVDFTLEITYPVDKTHNISPGGLSTPGGWVDYTIHLQTTGVTTLTEEIVLSSNINDVDDLLNNIIDGYTFIPPTVSNVDAINGVDVILRVWSFENISSDINNHPISFTVYGSCDVNEDGEYLTRWDNGLLNFLNTPYFTLAVNPIVVYSFPGDTAEFNIHIIRHHDYSHKIDLELNSVIAPLCSNHYFTINGEDRHLLNEDENDAILHIEVTTDLQDLIDHLYPGGDNDNLLITITGTEYLGVMSSTDTATLRIRGFNISVTPRTTNEVYPDSIIQYDVTLTRYNTYEGHDEDIILNSDVYRTATLDHILSFNPAVNFANGGVFPETGTPGTYSTIMTVGTTSKDDDLPITISFDVSGTGNTTNLVRIDDDYLTIVAVPDFSLSLSPATDGRGIPTETVDYIITLTRDPGFTENVTITNVNITNDETGLPLAQASYQLANNVFTGAETTKDLSIILADDTGYWGDYTVTIQGVGDDITSPRSADAPLIVMDFAIFLTEDTKSVTPDSNVSYEVRLSRYNGYDREVVASTTLTDLIGLGDIAGVIFNLPSNIFSYTGTPQQTAFMTVYTTLGATEQTIEFKVTGTDNTPTALQRDTTGFLNIITAEDYNLTLAARNGIDTGMPTETITYVVTLEALNNFKGDVTITEVLLSDSTNITDSFEGDDFTLSGDGDEIELHLALGADILWGDRTVQVKGDGSPGERYSNEADLHIIDFDIEIDEPKNQSITDIEPNNVATYGITLVRHNDYDRAVTIVTDITPENYPDIISSSVFANSGTFLPGTTETQLIIYASNSTPEPITFNVVGTDIPTGLERSDIGSLTITDGVTPDFFINVSPPSQTVEPGGNTSYTIIITKLNGHSEPILLSTNLKTDNDEDIAQVVFMSSGDNTTTLSVITTDNRNSITPITFIVYGNTATTERSASADLIIYKAPDDPVTPPGGGTTPTPRTNDFNILIEPDEETVMAGESTNYKVLAIRNGFNGPISLTTDLLDNSEVTSAIFEDQILEPGMNETTLNVNTSGDADNTEITFTVEGNGTPGTRSDAAILNIRKEDEEIPEELPSTGSSAWIWMAVAIISIIIWAYLIIQKPSTEEE